MVRNIKKAPYNAPLPNLNETLFLVENILESRERKLNFFKEWNESVSEDLRCIYLPPCQIRCRFSVCNGMMGLMEFKRQRFFSLGFTPNKHNHIHSAFCE